MSDKIRVLIADDEPMIRNGIKEFLQERGLHCEAVGTQADVMRLVDRGYNPEVALLDVLLPEGRITRDFDNEIKFGLTAGLRLVPFIKREVGDFCRIIVSSGLDGYRRQAQEAGAWGYLCKPTRDFYILFDILGEGFLRSSELGQPTIDVNDLILERLSSRGERKSF